MAAAVAAAVAAAAAAAASCCSHAQQVDAATDPAAAWRSAHVCPTGVSEQAFAAATSAAAAADWRIAAIRELAAPLPILHSAAATKVTDGSEQPAADAFATRSGSAQYVAGMSDGGSGAVAAGAAAAAAAASLRTVAARELAAPLPIVNGSCASISALAVSTAESCQQSADAVAAADAVRSGTAQHVHTMSDALPTAT
eukprot:TRINITY_DN1964_c7_g1_i1.p1 TRINITY_DN1964_c7_g1~~TRINITY_DN1964_c7_g1_i1.p1  ORF type:complete len:205 (+),score=76.50 TRINITY_DN1964_c7_g1_i1:24-617(+)